MVTNGTTDGLRHLLAVLPPGPVALEDPGYRAAVETVRGVGRDVRDLPGAEPVTDLTGVVAAYVTPAHQHPLGRVMPAADRVALLDAARRADAVVVEDDYDSEFRYDVAPVPALASLDRDRVAYLGTAAKSVAPCCGSAGWCRRRRYTDAINARRVVTHEGAPWPVQRAFLAAAARRVRRQGGAHRAPGVRRAGARVAAALRRTPSWPARSPGCTPPGCSPRPTRCGPAAAARGPGSRSTCSRTTAARRA